MSRKKFRGGRRTNAPPDGERWIWHTLRLRESPAWRGQSIHCRKLLEFLELEHLRHGGNENGRLVAPYNQLEEFGIGRKYIAPAIQEAEKRGLIRLERGGRKGTVFSEMNRFRLTYHWTSCKRDGLWDWSVPTDDWLSLGEELQ